MTLIKHVDLQLQEGGKKEKKTFIRVVVEVWGKFRCESLEVCPKDEKSFLGDSEFTDSQHVRGVDFVDGSVRLCPLLSVSSLALPPFPPTLTSLSILSAGPHPN